MSLVEWVIGRRLANREHRERRIGAFEGVPAMGLDGVGSSAYGPEAALTILIPLGAAGLIYIGPIMAAIIGLLVILYASYRQTIAAYPNNGGAYVVSRENLGRNASLLAAAALMIDYVRLCRMVAEDGFLPRPFAIVGRRLVFSVGIFYLAISAGLLLLAFGGITDRLIPLFAIGAFLTFTMSQVG